MFNWLIHKFIAVRKQVNVDSSVNFSSEHTTPVSSEPPPTVNNDNKLKYEKEIDLLTDHWLFTGIKLGYTANNIRLYSGQKHPTKENFELDDVIELTNTGIWLTGDLWYAKEYCDTADCIHNEPITKLIFCALIEHSYPLIEFPPKTHPADFLHRKEGFFQQADVFVSQNWDSIIKNLSEKDSSYSGAVGHYRLEELTQKPNAKNLKEVWVKNSHLLSNIEKRKATLTKQHFEELYSARVNKDDYETFEMLEIC